MAEKYIGIDFGGSNLRISEVNPETGDLVGDMFAASLASVNTNEMLEDIILANIPGNANIGISAAGNIDEKKLVILESANSKITSKITFGKMLKERGYNVAMTNDMKAAVQAAARYGKGKEFENVLLATFSSGYNCAITRNGVNDSTAEFGHMVYKPNGDLFCGCGHQGHLEIYLSGNGAAAMAKQFFFTTHQTEHPILRYALEDYNTATDNNYNEGDLRNPEVHAAVITSIGSKHVYRALSDNVTQEPQRSIRSTQAAAIADSFGKMTSAFNPIEIIVAMGSQTKDWKLLFEPAIQIYESGGMQLPSLPIPKVVRTELPEIGVQGAVGYFIAENS